jgi:hypothetical protein
MYRLVTHHHHGARLPKRPCRRACAGPRRPGPVPGRLGTLGAGPAAKPAQARPARGPCATAAATAAAPAAAGPAAVGVGGRRGAPGRRQCAACRHLGRGAARRSLLAAARSLVLALGCADGLSACVGAGPVRIARAHVAPAAYRTAPPSRGSRGSPCTGVRQCSPATSSLPCIQAPCGANTAPGWLTACGGRSSGCCLSS